MRRRAFVLSCALLAALAVTSGLRATAHADEPSPHMMVLPNGKLDESKCGACHTTAEKEEHAGFPAAATQCKACHSEHQGRDGDIVKFNPASFDHVNVDFKLEGAHAKTPCASCHVPQPGADGKPFVTYKPTPTKCEACHVTGIPAPGAGTTKSSVVPASGMGTPELLAAHEVRHAHR